MLNLNSITFSFAVEENLSLQGCQSHSAIKNKQKDWNTETDSVCIIKFHSLKLFKVEKQSVRGKLCEGICSNYLLLLLTFLDIMTNLKASMGKMLWVD